MNTRNEISPGEARTRQRQRRQMLTYVFAGTLGGAIGFFARFADQGDGSLFKGEWEALAFDPLVAIALAVTLVLTFIAFPLWCFTLIDEVQRDRNLVGFAGGGMVVLGGVPAWVVLHAGGLVPAPSSFAIWGLCFAATMIVFAVAWLRSR